MTQPATHPSSAKSGPPSSPRWIISDRRTPKAISPSQRLGRLGQLFGYMVGVQPPSTHLRAAGALPTPPAWEKSPAMKPPSQSSHYSQMRPAKSINCELWDEKSGVTGRFEDADVSENRAAKRTTLPLTDYPLNTVSPTSLPSTAESFPDQPRPGNCQNARPGAATTTMTQIMIYYYTIEQCRR